MKYIRNISRLLVGAVFIFSGFVKAIDPLGSKYKLIDYFQAFGTDFLDPLALPLAILLSTIVLVIGISLVLKIRMREISWAVLVFMIFFTIITLYLAIANPISDCGCFGDALIMTNWETFLKNCVLLALVFIIFYQRNLFVPSISKFTQWGVIGLAFIGSIGLSLYCLAHLPLLDFRPYKIGTNIPEKMEIPSDALKPKFKTVLFYKKDGEVKKFSADSLPDSSWKWVKTETVQVQKGYVPPIHDFSVESINNGADITDSVLTSNKAQFLIISYDLSQISEVAEEKLSGLFQKVKQNNQGFLFLTASPPEEIQKFQDKTDAAYPFYYMDEITLKTIIRSNPGLMVIQNGTNIGKWHYNDIPKISSLSAKPIAASLNEVRSNKSFLLITIYILGFCLVISVFKILQKQ